MCTLAKFHDKMLSDSKVIKKSSLGARRVNNLKDLRLFTDPQDVRRVKSKKIIFIN